MDSIGAYEVLASVGEGGMASVYRCRHRSPAKADQQGGEVAVKVMHAHLAKDPGFQARFEREAGIGLQLDHPSIVKVLDLVVDQDRLALVLEWVEGEALDDRLARAPLAPDEALAVFDAVARAIAYAHGQQVVHRDLKPANIMLTPEGAKVLDFGIAKSAGHAGLTRTGTGMGTPWYMAPEQYVQAKEVDHRADIYALGMVLAEMLGGGLPWPRETSEYEVLRRKADGELALEAVPKELQAVIRRCLEPDPEDRWASVPMLLAALESARHPGNARSTTKARARKQAPKKAPKKTGSHAGCWALSLMGCMAVLAIGPAIGIFLFVVALIVGDTEDPYSYERATGTDGDFDGLAEWEDPCPDDASNSCSIATSSLYNWVGVRGLWKGDITATGLATQEVFIRINFGGARGSKVGDVDYVWDGNTCGGNLIRGWEDAQGLHFSEDLVRGYGCTEGAITLVKEGTSALSYTWSDGATTFQGTLYPIYDDY